MAFRSVSNSGDRKYLNYKDFRAGDTLVTGQYLKMEISKNYGKPVYLFRTDDGNVTCLNGTGSLDRAMESVRAGDYTKVIYRGKNEIKTGPFKGKLANNFDVLVDDERSVPNSAPAAVSASEVEDEDNNIPEASYNGPSINNSAPETAQTAAPKGSDILERLKAKRAGNKG